MPAGDLNLDERVGRKFIKPPPNDSRVEKWTNWLDLIDKDLTDIFGNREVWRTVNKIIDDHPAMPPSHFFEFQALNYATTQAVAVRRQSEVGANPLIAVVVVVVANRALVPNKEARFAMAQPLVHLG